MEKSSVYLDGEQEALRYKWIESEKAGHDLGEAAIRRWVQNHWWGYLRARWLEHLQGKRFWVELDRGDFGLLQRKFHDNTLLLDRILDRLKAGQENLDIICWAHTWGVPRRTSTSSVGLTPGAFQWTLSFRSSRLSTSTAGDWPTDSIPNPDLTALPRSSTS
jgi:hypothetical protein